MLAGVVGIALLVLVVVALYHGGSTAVAENDETGTGHGDPGGPATPDALAPPPFRLTWQGYDPEQVDAYVARVTAAYERLWTRHTAVAADVARPHGAPRTPIQPVDPPAPPTAAARGPVILPKVRAQPDEGDEGDPQDG